MSALEDELKAEIQANGPIGIDRFMALALGHPEHGYYMTRDPLGRAGDFITAPEISQMFGELIGLWMAANWTAMGKPDPVLIIELGPGRGTLMDDAMRAAGAAREFAGAADLHLVETSPVLKAEQERRLKATWHETLDTVPAGPAFIIANEFFDALPVRQFVRRDEGWHERLVGLNAEEALHFTATDEPVETELIPERLLGAPPGSLFEISPASLSLARAIGQRAARDAAYGLIIDYGYVEPGIGETLQAVKGHDYADILVDPGAADLTAHVDFDALRRAFRESGAAVFGPHRQREFLKRLGIETRAAALMEKADERQAAEIEAALTRLTGREEMGRLFKVLGLASPDLPAPEGF